MSSVRFVSLLVLTMAGAVLNLEPVFGDQKCVPRSMFLQDEDNQHFAGMFRIALKPPDLHDVSAVQRHLAYAEVWTRTIFDEMSQRTRHLCTVFTSPEGFPDLRAALVVNRTANRTDKEASFCTRELREVMKHVQPTDEQIRTAVGDSAYSYRPRQPEPGAAQLRPREDADNILRMVFPILFREGSLLHALAAADEPRMAAVDVTEFRAWLESQRSLESPQLKEMSHCVPPIGDPDSLALRHDRVQAAILPPGEIDLSRHENPRLPPGPLQYAVVVGDPDEPPGFVVWSELETKYCNNDHTFQIGDDPLHRISVTLRPQCESVGLYDLDYWTIIYCRPMDCGSEEVEKAVVSAIAADPAILDAARRSSDTNVPRGPYLVVIKKD